MSNTPSAVGPYDQIMLQYQQFQKQSQFHLFGSFQDQDMKSMQMQASQAINDQFGLLGLLGVIRMSNPALTYLALGIDLTTLGLNPNSSENLYKKLASPWSEESVKGKLDFCIPECYNAKLSTALNQDFFSRFRLETLFYIFYSMPKDEVQLLAANELRPLGFCDPIGIRRNQYEDAKGTSGSAPSLNQGRKGEMNKRHARGWFYHKDLRLWFTSVTNMEPAVKTNTCEHSCYICFDPNTWATTRKENVVLQQEMLEKSLSLLQQ